MFLLAHKLHYNPSNMTLGNMTPRLYDAYHVDQIF